jgi:predicted kinase
MAGMPGTGKTTLALAFGQTLGWPVVDKDTLKSPLLLAGVAEEVAGPASYALLLAMAQDLLVRQRLSTILDSPGRFRFVLERAQEMAEQAGATLKIVFCSASRELRDRRMSMRAARPSQWKADAGLTNEEERQMFAHLPSDALALDTCRPLESCVAEVLAYLQQ